MNANALGFPSVVQGPQSPHATLMNIARALALEAARRTQHCRHRVESSAQMPLHAPEVEALDAASLVAVTGGGGSVRRPPNGCMRVLEGGSLHDVHALCEGGC